MIKGSLSNDLGKARRYLPQYMRLFVDATSREMVRNVRDHTPVLSGKLKESIETIDTDRRFTSTGIHVWSGGAKSDLQRASYTEWDTAPHIIRAKTDAGLKFFNGKAGKTIVRQSVKHPGTTGAHMFAKGADDTQEGIKRRGTAMLMRWSVRYGL